jgi:hypothetical protein
MTSITICKQEYEGIREELKSELTEELEAEVEFAEFETDNEGLWETPGVDSKAVVKLSPTVEKYIGAPIDLAWIKCGGYDSVPEAVEHIMEQLELELESN